jgi:hypothetical protein
MDLARRVDSGGLFFRHFPNCAKKKPAIETDAGFPVFSRPQRQAWILCADHAGKRQFCLPALSHRSGQENGCWVICSALSALFTKDEGNGFPIDQITAKTYSV